MFYRRDRNRKNGFSIIMGKILMYILIALLLSSIIAYAVVPKSIFKNDVEIWGVTNITNSTYISKNLNKIGKVI